MHGDTTKKAIIRCHARMCCASLSLVVVFDVVLQGCPHKLQVILKIPAGVTNKQVCSEPAPFANVQRVLMLAREQSRHIFAF
jgi:hypothetical protein